VKSKMPGEAGKIGKEEEKGGGGGGGGGGDSYGQRPTN
jgi:hypothetical protein